MRNETTRLAGVKAVAQVAGSRLDLDLGGVLEPVLAQLTAFLRKASRPLRQAALAAIEARPGLAASGLLCPFIAGVCAAGRRPLADADAMHAHTLWASMFVGTKEAPGK